MSNCAFGWPLYGYDTDLYTPSLNGGSWGSGDVALASLKDRRLSRVARSTDALAASTTFDWDLGVARPIGVLPAFIPNITKSTTPTIRWRASTTADFAVVNYDSGNIQYFPTGHDAETTKGLNVWKVIFPASVQTYRYWRCSIIDTGNVDGYVDVAFGMPCGIYSPTINMNVGAAIGLDDPTIRTETDASSFVFDEKPRRRTARFILDHITQAEALGTVWKMQRLLGTSGQLVWVYDAADTTYLHERSFLATMRSLSMLEEPRSDQRHATGFELMEEL